MTHFSRSNSENNGPAPREVVIPVLIVGALGALILGYLNINRTQMALLSIIFIFTLILAGRGYIIFARWIALLSALTIFSVLFYQNYGIRDTAMTGLVVVIISAGLLAGRTGTLVIGTIILGEVIIFGFLESFEVINNKFSSANNLSDYITSGLAILSVTILQALTITLLNKNIVKAEQELSERIKTEKQLRDAENRYRNLVEKIPAVVYISEPGENGVWHYVSPQITSLTGYSVEEWLGNRELWFSRIHPDDRERIIRDERHTLNMGNMPQLEYRLLTREGNYIWLNDESLQIIDSDQHELVQGFLHNITARKETENQLQKRLMELNAVSGVSKTLSADTRLRNFIEEIGQQIRLAFNASNLFISILDPLTNLIHFPYDYEDNKKQKDLPIKFGEGMTSKVIETKKTLLINRNWDTVSPRYNVILRTTKPVKSSLTVPIIIRDKAIGTICMDNVDHEDAFTEGDVRLLETIAANLAVAIDNSFLQESLKHELAIQDKLISELEIKNAELERFTYTASHDLKSPLITIRGYLGYLEKDALAGNFERLQADIKRIAEATDKMHRLLNELLQLSRVGRVINEPQEIPFEEIVREALKRVEGQLTEWQVKVEVGSGLPTVYGDKERLVEVIQNFVDNACKFTKNQAAPVIQIGFNKKDSENIFYVKDNGIGIKKEFHEKVFGLFDKLDPASNGTGIGLALVKRIIEVHGGKTWVESEGVNQGTTFFFTLANKT